ncbi:hypothetical protein ACE1SV_39380 [Streptomyces sp. E-15]
MAAERALRGLAVGCHLDRHVLPNDSYDRGVGHLGEDARTLSDECVTQCAELVPVGRLVTACDRAAVLEPSPSRGAVIEARKTGLVGAVGCYEAYESESPRETSCETPCEIQGARSRA